MQCSAAQRSKYYVVRGGDEQGSSCCFCFYYVQHGGGGGRCWRLESLAWWPAPVEWLLLTRGCAVLRCTSTNHLLGIAIWSNTFAFAP